MTCCGRVSAYTAPQSQSAHIIATVVLHCEAESATGFPGSRPIRASGYGSGSTELSAAERARRRRELELQDDDLSDYIDSDEDGDEYESDSAASMEASYADLMREERLSARAGIMEDLEEERKLAEEEAAKRKRKQQAASGGAKRVHAASD